MLDSEARAAQFESSRGIQMSEMHSSAVVPLRMTPEFRVSTFRISNAGSNPSTPVRFQYSNPSDRAVTLGSGSNDLRVEFEPESPGLNSRMIRQIEGRGKRDLLAGEQRQVSLGLFFLVPLLV
jgi:hypothetical protein